MGNNFFWLVTSYRNIDVSNSSQPTSQATKSISTFNARVFQQMVNHPFRCFSGYWKQDSIATTVVLFYATENIRENLLAKILFNQLAAFNFLLEIRNIFYTCLTKLESGFWPHTRN